MIDVGISSPNPLLREEREKRVPSPIKGEGNPKEPAPFKGAFRLMIVDS